MSTTPVAIIVFNRPDNTERVLAAVAAHRPERVLVIADGARADRHGEADQCAATRAVFERIDWPCEVTMNVAPSNMGVDARIVSGISWVFEHVDEAVILEDDCVPHPSFFRFAHEMLERYRDDDRILTVSGNNFADGHRRGTDSYHFSHFPLTTGFATWRRAWSHYSQDMADFRDLREGDWLGDLFANDRQAAFWNGVYDQLCTGRGFGWDRCWNLSSFAVGGLTVIPNVNLIQNIGFTSDATHTTSSTLYSELPAHEMPFPLVHPPFVIADLQADARTFRLRMQGGGVLADRLHHAALRTGVRALTPLAESVRRATARFALRR